MVEPSAIQIDIMSLEAVMAKVLIYVPSNTCGCSHVIMLEGDMRYGVPSRRFKR